MAETAPPAGEDVKRVARAVREHKTQWMGDWPDGHLCDTCGRAVPYDHQETEVLAALSARPVEAQEGYWQLAQVLREVEDERDAALARAEAAEAVIEKVRAEVEQVESAGRVYGYGVAHDLRALLDTDSEGREV